MFPETLSFLNPSTIIEIPNPAVGTPVLTRLLSVTFLHPEINHPYYNLDYSNTFPQYHRQINYPPTNPPNNLLPNHPHHPSSLLSVLPTFMSTPFTPHPQKSFFFKKNAEFKYSHYLQTEFHSYKEIYRTVKQPINSGRCGVNA